MQSPLLDRLCRTLYLSVNAEAFYLSLKIGSDYNSGVYA